MTRRWPLPILLALPGLAAAQVRVLPDHPRLGDTISVLIGGDPAERPQVWAGDRLFPAYRLEDGRYRALIPTTPLEQPGARRVRVTVGGTTEGVDVTVESREFPMQHIRMPKGKKELRQTEVERQRVAAFKSTESPEKAWKGAFRAPLSTEVSTVFGVRRTYDGVLREDYYHRGLDYRGAAGTPVHASAAGRVGLVGRVREGFRTHGNVVGLDHGQGVTTLYLHLSRIDVKPGQQVTAGQVIGRVGQTGAATGPHLHWGLYVHGESVDPEEWLTTGVD